MKPVSPYPALVLRRTKRMGLGVYAGEKIAKGAVIEVCPVLPLSRKDERMAQVMSLCDYTFAWGERPCLSCIVLGWGALYNHSHQPNATFKQIAKRRQMKFIALRDIAKGEQIFIDYEWEHQEYLLKGMVVPPNQASRIRRQDYLDSKAGSRTTAALGQPSRQIAAAVSISSVSRNAKKKGHAPARGRVRRSQSSAARQA